MIFINTIPIGSGGGFNPPYDFPDVIGKKGQVLVVNESETALIWKDEPKEFAYPAYLRALSPMPKIGWEGENPLQEGYDRTDRLIDGRSEQDTYFQDGFYLDDRTVMYIDFLDNYYYVSELKWTQSVASTHGRWVVWGIDENNNKVELSAPFELGGSTEFTIALDSSVPIKIFYLIGYDGTTSSASWLYEINLKIVKAT